MIHQEATEAIELIYCWLRYEGALGSAGDSVVVESDRGDGCFVLLHTRERNSDERVDFGCEDERVRWNQ